MQPLKRRQIVALFGETIGTKLLNWLDPCCDNFCDDVKECVGVTSEGEPDLFLNQQGDFVAVGGEPLTFDNGLIRDGNNVQLGGDIIENTILGYDLTQYFLILGDLTNQVGVGNIGSDGIARLSANLDNVILISNADSNGLYGGLSMDLNNGTTATVFKNQTNGFDYGLANINKTSITTHASNMYYGSNDGAGNTTDFIRYEVGYNYVTPANSYIEGMIFRDFVTRTTYNGFYTTQAYSQLEFNKTETGQSTGTTWTIDDNGATMYVGGVKQFRITNSVIAYADDATAIGAGLTSGDVFKTTTGGSTFLKIVP